MRKGRRGGWEEESKGPEMKEWALPALKSGKYRHKWPDQIHFDSKGTHSFPGRFLGLGWVLCGMWVQTYRVTQAEAWPGGFHSRWMDKPELGSEEEKKRFKFTSAHLIKFFTKSKLPRARL